ncbi:hypothetical protein BH24ACT3_BH24ACT3_13280 [soil metagenome]
MTSPNTFAVVAQLNSLARANGEGSEARTDAQSDAVDIEIAQVG